MSGNTVRGRIVVPVMVVVFFFIGIDAAWAEKVEIVDVKVTHYSVFTKWLPANDEAGHVIGVGQREGEGIFGNGESAVYSNVSTFEVKRGCPTVSEGFTKFAFKDSSVFFIRWTCETIPGKDGLGVSKGKGEIYKGTGRFEGIKGTAVFSGKQLKSSSEDPKLTSIMDATLNYTLP